MTIQEVVDFVGDHCKESIDRFTGLASHRGPEIDGQVQVYVQGLASWSVGGLHWPLNSERYFGKKGGQGKRGRVVELAPVSPESVTPANFPRSGFVRKIRPAISPQSGMLTGL